MAWIARCLIAIGALCGPVAASPAAAGDNCKCRANGQLFEQGQIACVRGKLLRCEMLLNNSSWKTIADTCPEASLAPRTPQASLPPRTSLPSC